MGATITPRARPQTHAHPCARLHVLGGAAPWAQQSHPGRGLKHTLTLVHACTCSEVLHLGRNKLTSLVGIGRLHSLRVLGVASNRLRSIHPELSELRALQELYADHNGIECMRPLAGMGSLHTLELSSNRLAIVDCETLCSLEERYPPVRSHRDIISYSVSSRMTQVPLRFLRSFGSPTTRSLTSGPSGKFRASAI